MQHKVLLLTNNNNVLRLADWLVEQGENVTVYSEKLTKQFVLELNPSITISYNYIHIISKDIIESLHNNVLNLHISLLPWNRGAEPNFWSFMEDTPKGVTIHKIDEGLDTGNILYQKELNFDEKKETFASSYEKLQDEIFELFISNWQNIKEGKYDEALQRGGGSYHSEKEFREFIKNTKFSWDENVYQYKMKIRK